MNKEAKQREVINKLAQDYRRQINPTMTHEQARDRVMKALKKKG